MSDARSEAIELSETIAALLDEPEPNWPRIAAFAARLGQIAAAQQGS